ncbi:hypothetical protein AB0958_19570 [Streptomyces sp. NPDC006655]|uniref:hypothetical protein n=1 Tax=Streptomyces sp. NPDC006655 TaxID=3156898 RepID=UPI003453F03A
MQWAQFVITTAVLAYVLLSIFRFARDPATSLGDAFTPLWMRRIRNRRITNRMREEYRRKSTDARTKS